MNNISVQFSRFAIFVIYFWFGLLKVIGESPATPMVKTLFSETILKFSSAISFEQFIMAFGIFEMVVGILFLIPRLEKVALSLLTLHLTTTCLPLWIMRDLLWTKAWVPTMEGQYIIKNLAIIALALNVYKK